MNIILNRSSAMDINVSLGEQDKKRKAKEERRRKAKEERKGKLKEQAH
jgi:hypothetical protein